MVFVLLTDMAVGEGAGLKPRQRVVVGTVQLGIMLDAGTGEAEANVLVGMPCPAACAASVAENEDIWASVSGVNPPLPPADADPLASLTWLDSHEPPLAIEATAPMTPPITRSGNMVCLPKISITEVEHETCHGTFKGSRTSG